MQADLLPGRKSAGDGLQSEVRGLRFEEQESQQVLDESPLLSPSGHLREGYYRLMSSPPAHGLSGWRRAMIRNAPCQKIDQTRTMNPKKRKALR